MVERIKEFFKLLGWGLALLVFIFLVFPWFIVALDYIDVVGILDWMWEQWLTYMKWVTDNEIFGQSLPIQKG